MHIITFTKEENGYYLSSLSLLSGRKSVILHCNTEIIGIYAFNIYDCDFVTVDVKGTVTYFGSNGEMWKILSTQTILGDIRCCTVSND